MKMKSSIVLLIALIFMWGLSWPIAKVGLSYTSPPDFIELRFVFATVTMFFIALVSKNFVLPRVKDLPVILVVSFFQMGLLMSLSAYGLSVVGAGKASFLIYTTSVWIIPLSVFFGKKMGWKEWLSFCLGGIGVLILVNPLQINWHEKIWLGDLAVLLSSFSWAIGILFARHMKWHRTPLQLLPWQLLFATLCTVALGYYQGVSLIPTQLNWPLLWTLLYTGSISTAIGYWVMVYVSIKFSPSVTSLALVWVPVISLVFSYLFLNEAVTFGLFIAVIFILTGILLLIYSERKREKQEQLFKQVP